MNQEENPPKQDKIGLQDVWQRVRDFFDRLTDLKVGLDREGTIRNIYENKLMQGANAWLLMCSIMIASLGLDLNSQAIIIGAMLISPLMSPILGVGLAVGTNNRDSLLVALQHFGIAIGIAIVTSTLYFFLTPFGNITEEISRRTEPTFLDVLVAFFGGVAGIISGSRKDLSNAMPGVAIATALMPPLCVTGFGLAKWIEISIGLSTEADFDAGAFILNSFYLFFLNSFFVAFATFIIVRSLRFPLKRYADRKMRRRTTAALAFFCLVMIIPSLFILQDVMRKVNNDRNKDLFISRYLGDQAIYIDESKLVETSQGRKLILKVYGSAISNENLDVYREGLSQCGLADTDIEIISTSEIDLSTFKLLQSQVSDFGATLEEKLEASREVEATKDSEIQILRTQIDSLMSVPALDIRLLEEIKIMIEQIQTMAFAQTAISDQVEEDPVLLIKWLPAKTASSRRRDLRKVEEFLHHRDSTRRIKVLAF